MVLTWNQTVTQATDVDSTQTQTAISACRDLAITMVSGGNTGLSDQYVCPWRQQGSQTPYVALGSSTGQGSPLGLWCNAGCTHQFSHWL